MKKKKIVITGGHLTPALAVIEELQRRGDWEIFFFGRQYAAEGEKTLSMEAEIIPQKGIWFIPLSAGRIQRKFTSQTIVEAILAGLRLPLGFFQAFWYLARIRPNVILSFGGYLSVPAVFAGWLLGIPSLAHEQTAVRGLGTKINTLFVEKIAVSWPQTVKLFPQKKVTLTGNPVRKEIFRVNEEIWEVFNFDKILPLIFITGGNQGSHIINQVVGKSLPQLVRIANVFHQSGHLRARGDFERLEEARKKLPLRLKKRYHVKKYLVNEEMGTFLNKADLVVSRAGANITTEVAALGKPTLFIPIPWSYANEQMENARMLKKLGLAEILSQEKLSSRTFTHMLRKMSVNLNPYKQKAAQAKKLVKLDAAAKIVDLIEEITK